MLKACGRFIMNQIYKSFKYLRETLANLKLTILYWVVKGHGNWLTIEYFYVNALWYILKAQRKQTPHALQGFTVSMIKAKWERILLFERGVHSVLWKCRKDISFFSGSVIQNSTKGLWDSYLCAFSAGRLWVPLLPNHCQQHVVSLAAPASNQNHHRVGSISNGIL